VAGTTRRVLRLGGTVEFSPKIFERARRPFSGSRALQRGDQARRIRRGTQEMGGLDQPFVLIGGDQDHRRGTATRQPNRLAIRDSTVPQLGQSVTRL